jgi:undecaprenyl diphosphate synthase
MQNLENKKIPQHIAIIMDGNRRWAKKHSYPSVYGHKKGVEAVKDTVKAASDLGVKYLTIYAFSTENWNRSRLEVNALMFLLEKTLKDYRQELMENKIKLHLSGRIEQLPAKVRELLKESAEYLSKNEGMILNIALNYGGRQEIVDAVNKIIEKGYKEIDEKIINENLYTYPLPDPDLIIRTSGEMRLSNFLLWQSAYSEIYITDTLWPDFNSAELSKAISAYLQRERRLGK